MLSCKRAGVGRGRLSSGRAQAARWRRWLHRDAPSPPLQIKLLQLQRRALMPVRLQDDPASICSPWPLGHRRSPLGTTCGTHAPLGRCLLDPLAAARRSPPAPPPVTALPLLLVTTFTQPQHHLNQLRPSHINQCARRHCTVWGRSKHGLQSPLPPHAAACSCAGAGFTTATGHCACATT